MIKNMYDGSESCVRMNHGQSDIFDVNNGVRQGDSNGLYSSILYWTS